jgi:asparagine synthetase B (glutamine-hydrolysing)
MCGIILATEFNSTEEILNSISHRGIERTDKKLEGVTLCHHRLPIQTVEGDNWYQPKQL